MKTGPNNRESRIRLNNLGSLERFFLMKVISIIVITLLVMSSFNFTTHASSLTFSTPVKLGAGYDPNVQSFGSDLYVAWTDRSHGIFFRASDDLGATWNNSIQIGSAGAYPIISATGNYVYAVWTDGAIMYSASFNNGQTWTQPIVLSQQRGDTPYIAAQGLLVAVVYNLPGVGSFVTVSSNGGASWTTPFQYSNGPEPQVAVSGITVYAISDNIDRSSSQFAVSHNLGESWTVSGLPGGSEEWIVATGSNVYAVWETKSSKSVVWFLSSSDYGFTFTTRVISQVIPDAWNPMIYAIGQTVWVGIQELGGKAQIWMLTSTNGGLSWSQQSVSGTGEFDGYVFSVPTTDAINVFAMWIHQSGDSSYAMATYSSDGGSSWSTTNLGISDPQNDVAIGDITSQGSFGMAAWEYQGTIYFSSGS